MRRFGAFFCFYVGKDYNKHMNDDSAIMRLQDVCKTYQKDKKEIVALKNISVDISKGSFVLLSGKAAQEKRPY